MFIKDNAEFCRHKGLRATTADCLTNQLFVMTVSVGIGAVDQIHPEIKGMLYGTNGLFF